jgi:8-amino-7-oxononanoate synthase
MFHVKHATHDLRPPRSHGPPPAIPSDRPPPPTKALSLARRLMPRYSRIVPLADELDRQLTDLSTRGRLRETRSFSGPDRAHPKDQSGSQLLSFCSNDYLGLSHHPALALSAARAATEMGFGSCASRLLAGQSEAHTDLEAGLASFLGQPTALLFPTGYQTNLGVITALAGPDDLIASDAANHASIIDGCRLSRARVAIYPHANVAAAHQALTTSGGFRRRILVTESVFSMDGDRAPLAALASLVATQGAVLIVDEAHALGVVGAEGRGLSAETGVSPDVLVGTLGKAFASFGGFAAGSPALRSVLVNSSRSFIYSTSLPPSVAAAAQAGLNLASSPDGRERREHAHFLARRLRAGLARSGIQAPGEDLIIPIIIGSDRRALGVASKLLSRGFLIPAIRPPTVAEGTSRLRVTISATHTSSDVDRLVTCLAEVLASLPA